MHQQSIQVLFSEKKGVLSHFYESMNPCTINLITDLQKQTQYYKWLIMTGIEIEFSLRLYLLLNRF